MEGIRRARRPGSIWWVSGCVKRLGEGRSAQRFRYDRRYHQDVAKILLVEDNELNRDMLSRRLGRGGYEVSVAVDGEQALQMAATSHPDIILMDMSLPVLSGWEATRRLKADPSTASIPVIALTAHAMAKDREEALACGCNDYDTKPVELSRLLAKISDLLAKAR